MNICPKCYEGIEENMIIATWWEATHVNNFVIRRITIVASFLTFL